MRRTIAIESVEAGEHKEFVSLKLVRRFSQDIIQKIFARRAKQKDFMTDWARGDGIKRSLMGLFLIKDIVSLMKKKRVVAIDPSTTKIAFSVLNFDGRKIVLEHYGCVDLKTQSTMWKKMERSEEITSMLLNAYSPDELIVEQPIHIQNPQTTRYLTYIAASIIMAGLRHNVQVRDVPPITWKSFIGYKNVTKKEIAAWTIETDKTQANKRAKFERKERTRLIMVEQIPGFDCDDHDIVDSAAIGCWALANEAS